MFYIFVTRLSPNYGFSVVLKIVVLNNKFVVFIDNSIWLTFCLNYIQIRRQAIKELPQFATGENLPRVADILTQLLQTGKEH